jgi:metal-sulfur cluster biosynthetic enzyme
MTAVADQVREALRLVLDPELGENVVDLGLIYAVTADDAGSVRVTMTTTTPGCPATTFLVDGVAACVRALPGVTDADVTLTYDPPWTPARMSEDARARLQGAGGRR